MRLRLSIIAAVLLLLASSWASATPVVDGTPATGNSVGTSFTTSFPSGFGSSNTGDCCMLETATVTALSTAAGCAETGSGWTTTILNADYSCYLSFLTHIYSSGDTAPTCNVVTLQSNSWNMVCYKASNGCTFATGPTVENPGVSNGTVISGPGITGTPGDAHIFIGFANQISTFTNFNDSLTLESSYTAASPSLFLADAPVVSSGAIPTAQATVAAGSYGVAAQMDLEAATPTPTPTATPTPSPTPTPTPAPTPKPPSQSCPPIQNCF